MNPAGLPSCISSNGGSGRAVPTVSAGGGINNVLGTMLAIQQALNHSPAASGVSSILARSRARGRCRIQATTRRPRGGRHDGLKGFSEAIEAVFLQAAAQTCIAICGHPRRAG